MPNYQISATLDAQITGFRQGMNEAAGVSNSTTNTITNNLSRVDNTFRDTIRQINGNVRLFGDSADLMAQRVRAIQTAIDGMLRNGVRPADERIQQLTRTLSNLNSSSGLTNIARSSNQAATSLTNLGRVAQDAPFGFIGIQNNLNPLLESFQRLRSETGSNSAALRALGQSFIGPAGIGVALSLVTAAFTFYTMWQQRSNKATKDAKTDTDAYLKSLDQLRQSQLKGAQDAQKELTDLRILYKIATDVTISYGQRKDAVDKLQEQYPKYFKNISDELILAGKASAAYDKLTQSLLATARSRAAEALMTENSKKQLEIEEKIIDANAEQLAIEQQLKAARNKKTSTPASGGSAMTVGFNAADIGKASALVNLNDDLEDSIKKQMEYKMQLNDLTNKNLLLEKSVLKEVKKGADLADYTERKRKNKAAQFDQTNIGDTKGRKDFMDPTFAFRQAEGFREALRSLTAYQSGIGGLEKTLTDAQTRMIANAMSFNEQFGSIVKNGLKEALSDMASAIGTALAEGSNVLQAVGQSLLASLGGILVQLGEMAISVGTGVAAIGASLKSLNPVLAIAAGVALVALGSFFKGKASNIGGNIKGGGGGSNVTAFANGGVVYGPTNALIGEYSGAKNNPEVVAPLNKLKGMLGQNTFQPVLIPVINSKQLAILVKDGNDKLNRQ